MKFPALLGLARLLLRPEWMRNAGRSGEMRLGKFAADNGEPVMVFLIGIRINKWRQPRHWLPLLLAMPAALTELTAQPDGDLLGYRLLLGPGPRQAMLLQYWRNTGGLQAFARGPGSTHRAAQRRLWQHYAAAGGAVGVWHEMLPIAGGSYHSLYGNMPPTGIGASRPLRQLAWEMDAAMAPAMAPATPAATVPSRT
jgi:fumigallin biosynthesis monooxygenase-like protein